MDSDSVYDALLEHDVHGADGGQWAFGTGFEDPLAGVDTTVPDGVEASALGAYALALGDDALVYAHRLSEWCSRAPDLEEDVAIANVALDLLGQARLLLSRAAAADPSLVPVLPEGSPVPAEDALAFFRDERAFHNVRFVEPVNGDFAVTMVRLLVFAAYRLALLQRLSGSRDPVLAAVAAKGAREVAYHRDHAARWVVTLAQGTEESRRRTEDALRIVWPLLPELFTTHDLERRGADAGVGVDPSDLRAQVDATLGEVLAAASLDAPEVPSTGPVAGGTGRDGRHTEALGHLLAEMQSVARAHPTGRW